MSEVVKEVRFVCEDGRDIVTRSDSHYTATLLSMYDLHELPDVIELKGSVSEVVSAEFDAWGRAMERSHKGGSLLTHKAKWIMGEREGCRSCECDTKLDEIGPVYLQEVSRIIRVFDMEPWDYTGMLVNEKTPQHERMMYHQFVGGWLWANGGPGLVRFLIDDDDGISRGIAYLLEPIVDYIVEKVAKKREADEELDHSVHILLSVCYNALMRSRDVGLVKVYEYVLWDHVIEVAKAIKREDHQDMALLEFLAGRRPPESHRFTNLFLMLRTSDSGIKFICNQAMKWLPDDIDPMRLGLGCIIGKEDDLIIEEANLDFFIKQMCLGVMRALYRGVSLQRVATRVRVGHLEKLVGRKVVVKMLLSLLHYMQADPEHQTKRVDSFTRAIERHLSK
jgi:hypothetical protein